MSNQTLRQVYLAGAARVPFVKSGAQYRNIKSKELMLGSLNHLVTQYGLQGKVMGDVALGAVMNRSTEWSIPREVVLSSQLHAYTPAYFVH